MTTTAKHRSTWTAERFSEDLLKSVLVPSGKRVDLTKGVRK
jgi:hypothetical protein